MAGRVRRLFRRRDDSWLQAGAGLVFALRHRDGRYDIAFTIVAALNLSSLVRLAGLGMKAYRSVSISRISSIARGTRLEM